MHAGIVSNLIQFDSIRFGVQPCVNFWAKGKQIPSNSNNDQLVIILPVYLLTLSVYFNVSVAASFICKARKQLNNLETSVPFSQCSLNNRSARWMDVKNHLSLLRPHPYPPPPKNTYYWASEVVLFAGQKVGALFGGGSLFGQQSRDFRSEPDVGIM